jgi:serine protease inhibitor
MPLNPLVAANTRFAFKLFAELGKQQPGQNIFISPASIALALAMVYNGASGATQREMAEALELAAMSLEDINRANAELLRTMAHADPQVRLVIANSLWARKGIAFDPDFLRRGQEFYKAEIEELDFTNPSAASIINSWVRQRTNGKIEKIIDRIDAAAILFLLNAIYFKGNWTTQFDKRQTKVGAFHLIDGGRKQHPMMAQSGKYSYYQGRGFQAVSLPYGSRRLSMYVFLPEERSSLEAFQKTLNDKNWNAWMQQFHEMEGNIVLPQFKLEYEVKLNEALKTLGITTAFDSRRADFARMCTGTARAISIDEVKHKTFVEVNEEGTEAAAVTSVGMVLAAFTPKQTFTLIVDRPFFCAIQDNQSGTILFMGSIVDPT